MWPGADNDKSSGVRSRSRRYGVAAMATTKVGLANLVWQDRPTSPPARSASIAGLTS